MVFKKIFYLFFIRVVVVKFQVSVGSLHISHPVFLLIHLSFCQPNFGRRGIVTTDIVSLIYFILEKHVKIWYHRSILSSFLQSCPKFFLSNFPNFPRRQVFNHFRLAKKITWNITWRNAELVSSYFDHYRWPTVRRPFFLDCIRPTYTTWRSVCVSVGNWITSCSASLLRLKGWHDEFRSAKNWLILHLTLLNYDFFW